MRRTMLVIAVIGLLLAMFSTGVQAYEEGTIYSIMHPNHATRLRWQQAYEEAPRATLTLSRQAVPGHVSLLDHLNYIPVEWDQGHCGTCWAWAGTAAMSIGLDYQEGIFDLLSVQFISACNPDKSCCEGGWLYNVADFYTNKGFTIPQSNVNAEWQNGDGGCNVECADISTTPNYPVDTIEAQTIETHGVGQAQAIANIKNVLNQGKAVWFAFFLPTEADWVAFSGFWGTSPENQIHEGFDYTDGTEWDDGAGHAVLCVGYDDSDPTNAYWIILNSWGTAGGLRSNALFRMKTDINYDCTSIDSGEIYWSLYWQVLDLTFSEHKCYQVFRNTQDDVSGAMPISGIIDGTSFEDTTVTLGQTYYYWVRARTDAGWSDMSAVDDGCAVGEIVLTPSLQQAAAAPGETVAYELSLVNFTGVSGTFALTYADQSWFVSGPATAGSLADGGSTSVTLQVTVPVDAAWGEADTCTVVVVSSDPSFSNAATIVTRSEWATPPAVTTLPATNVMWRQATFTGALCPNGGETVYYFEYGSTTGYGQTTTPQTMSAGMATVTVNTAESELAVNSGYHYRLVATNSAGRTEGSDDAFTTREALWAYDLPPTDEEGVCFGVEFDGAFFWVTTLSFGLDSPELYKLEKDGSLLTAYDQPDNDSMMGWGDLAWDGSYLYGSAGGTIDQIDPETGHVTGVTIPGPLPWNLALAYDSVSDHFWVAGTYFDICEIDRVGHVVQQHANDKFVTGLAWDDLSPGGPWLWVYCTEGLTGRLIAQFDPRLGVYTGVTREGVYGADSETSAGACFALVDKTAAFIGLNMGTPGTLFAIELFEFTSVPHYVSPVGRHIPPFTCWTTAATNIQAAIDVAMSNDVVFVANGTYSVGVRVGPDDMPARIVSTNAVTVQSINGPAATIILGDGPNGDDAVRCVYLGENGILTGFTLSNGHTRTGGGDAANGGGAFVRGGLISNCVVTAGSASQYGGGIYFRESGTAMCCTISDNSAFEGGGIYGWRGGMLERCTVSANRADYRAGGICLEEGGVLNNCLVADNHAEYKGGGVRCSYGGILNNCTVAENTADFKGGGINTYNGGAIRNTVVVGNTAMTLPDLADDGEGMDYIHCCSPGLLGTGNLSDDPQFVAGAGDYHLLSSSPCVDAGTNTYAGGAFDMDGVERILGDAVDIGCYEQTRDADLTPPAISLPVAIAAGDEGLVECVNLPLVQIHGTKQSGVLVMVTNVWGGFITNGVAQTQGGTSWSNAVTPVYSVSGNTNVLVYGAASNTVGQVFPDAMVRVYGAAANTVGQVSADTTVLRIVAREALPLISITTDPVTTAYETVTFAISGTNNSYVVGMMTASNAANGTTCGFAATGGWTAPVLSLAQGNNTITVSGTNALGTWINDVVTVTRKRAGTGVPFIDITTADAIVPYTTNTVTVVGTHNAHVVGMMHWSNSLTHAASLFGPVTLDDTSWSLDAIPLGCGSNVIMVIGTNFAGVVASDSVRITRTMLGGADIGLSTGQLNFAATYGGSDPAVQMLTLTNAGESGMIWTNTISYSAGAVDWLTVTPVDGTLAIGEGITLTSSVTVTGLSVGIYTATNSIMAAEATNSPRSFVVQLTIGKASQTITFLNPGQQVVTNVTPIAATASSGLNVSLEVVSGAAILSVSNSPTPLTYTAPGIVTLRATQIGDANWAAAVAVDISFRVKADWIIPCDFDGDGMSDLSVYWPEGGTWYIRYSGGGSREQNWGWSESVPVPGDYDGDGITDLSVYWPADVTNNWYVLQSSDSQLKFGHPVDWGWGATVPVPGDYDGDGMTDIAVYWPEGGTWYIRYSGGGTREQYWGWSETVPVPGDYDGDGITDIAVYWPADVTNNWYILQSSDGQMKFGGPVDWGWSAAVPVPGDYDGDGMTDIAVYWPEGGTWYIRYSGVGTHEQYWGWSETVPVPGDYDGDGITDIAVYWPHDGIKNWFILQSSDGQMKFGGPVDWGWSGAYPTQQSYWLHWF